MSGKKLLIFGSLVLLLAAIPLTVYFSQQTQNTQSRAEKSTTLCFSTTTTNNATTPTPTTATSTAPPCSTTTTRAPGDSFLVDVVMNPGSNTVSTVRLNVVYDPTKLSLDTGAITPNASAVSPLIETTYATGNATARYGIIVNPNVGVDVTKALSQPTKIATIQFKVLPNATGTSSITFGETLVLSSNQQDGQDEDVLSSAPPLSVAVATTTPTPTVTNAQNQAPSCTSLNVDRTTSGPAPFSITFTANGRDTDGTIQKVTFNFGDGPVQDVLQSGGIGTNTVSTQVAHTYNNPGPYTATATFTDNAQTISANSATCTQAIIVTAKASGGETSTSTSSASTIVAVVTATPPVAEVATPTPAIENPGPSTAILGAGALGVLITIIGGFLLFAL